MRYPLTFIKNHKTVRIGPQIWMAENLKVTHYQNGDPISNLINDVFWNSFESGAMCDYDNNPENSNIYGKLYNWYAVSDERKIAPPGWHVPSDAEWKTLLDHMEVKIDPEKSPDERINHLLESKLTETSLNNGFNALPGGCRRIFDPGENEISPYQPNPELKFVGIGEVCCWWTSSEKTDHQYDRAIYRASGEDIWYHGVKRSRNRHKWAGLSVRCIMDCLESKGHQALGTISLNSSIKPELVSDIDGNIYKTILIGSQVWMAENLKVTHYQNGDPINIPKDSKMEKRNLSGAYCLNYQNLGSNGVTYGKLYSWYAINDKRKITPNGWHIPSNFEWTILFLFLGGKKNAGGKLKEIGTTHWVEPNAGATNDFGFTALPAGEYETASGFRYIGREGQWWSSTEKIFNVKHIEPYDYAYYGCYYFVNAWPSDVKYHLSQQNNARSVRCVKNFSIVLFLVYLIQSLAKVLFPHLFAKKLRFQKPEIEWVTIPAGTFKSKKYYLGKDEITMQSFKMSKYAITFEQYDIFCDETGRKKPSDQDWGRGNRPVICVSWKDAMAFAEWLGCRLPTNAEWEYACRAGTKTKFYTGNNLERSEANFCFSIGNHKTLPVGTFEPNLWGLYDMHGNVKEWCSPCVNLEPNVPVDVIGYGRNRHAMGGGCSCVESECADFSHTMIDQGGYWEVGFRIVSKD